MIEDRISLDELNALGRDEFVRRVGPVFEHSPWIAEAGWARRPFAGVEDLHQKLNDVVANSYLELQLALLRAQPELAGRPALEGTLTPSSMREQQAAGLTRLAPEEVAALREQTAAYQKRHGFPFVISARGNTKEAILTALRIRLHSSRETEIRTALEELRKISWYRLLDLVEATPLPIIDPSLGAQPGTFLRS